MSGHKPFDNLRAAIDANPERRAHVEREKQTMRDILTLTQMRAARGVTEDDLARAWEASQAHLMRAEHEYEQDTYLSTLRNYVAALGGTLELRAVFPDQTIVLGAPSTHPPDQQIA